MKQKGYVNILWRSYKYKKHIIVYKGLRAGKQKYVSIKLKNECGNKQGM